MIWFDKVSRFENEDIKLPTRATEGSAGYDLYVAEDTIIPSYYNHMDTLDSYAAAHELHPPMTLNEISTATKATNAKPTLVSTGVKCELEDGQYLELSMRSSTPLKHWLILANGVGIIDRDYYGNPSNDGEIFLQVINLTPFDILVQKDEKIGQGIIKTYLTTTDDATTTTRLGGFGSTT